MMQYPLVLIEWNDACGVGSDWRNPEDVETQEFPVRSVGFLINETDNYLTIASHYMPGNSEAEPQCCGEMHIPKGTIVRKVSIMPVPQGRAKENDNG